MIRSNCIIKKTISKLKWEWAGHVAEEQATVGQPVLRSGRPGETQGTEGNQRGDGRMTWILLSNTSILPHKT